MKRAQKCWYCGKPEHKEAWPICRIRKVLQPLRQSLGA
jgi:hypothetical protein